MADVRKQRKTCTKCKVEKEFSEFYTEGKADDGVPRLKAKCKPCHREYVKHKRTPDQARAQAYQRQWGSATAYEELVAAQGEGCAICGSATPGANNERFAIDHDHVTGVVRGLLCAHCNMGIGQLGDSVERLRAAIAYLENPPCASLGLRQAYTRKGVNR